MSKVSFKKFVEFVESDDEFTDEQINEIFGLFRNNTKLDKLKKEREKLKGMSAQKKAELDKALQDFKDGKRKDGKPTTDTTIDDATLDDVLSSHDRKHLAKMDKPNDRMRGDNHGGGSKNRTGRNFYESSASKYFTVTLDDVTSTDIAWERVMDDIRHAGEVDDNDIFRFCKRAARELDLSEHDFNELRGAVEQYSRRF
jgi:hypothetical protein